LPPDYVEQILLRLRRAGIVRSTRGARGGYVLDRSPEEITVRQIIQASELATFELHCLTHPVEESRCSVSHACSIRPVWQMLQRRIDDVLESVRLADLLHEEDDVRERVGLGRRVPEAEEPALAVAAAPELDPAAGRRGLPVLQL